MCSHLESEGRNSSKRVVQLKSAVVEMERLSATSSVVFGGDTNLRDKEVGFFKCPLSGMSTPNPFGGSGVTLNHGALCHRLIGCPLPFKRLIGCPLPFKRLIGCPLAFKEKLCVFDYFSKSPIVDHRS